jgi:hypothetical protein
MIRNPNTQTKKSDKPPKRYWKATESFIDLKFSHYVQIVLTVALLGVAATQAWVYFKQAKIMRGQLNQMQADQRPWIPDQVTITDALRFYDHRKPHIGLTFALENIGHSPAFQVGVSAMLWRFTSDAPLRQAAHHFSELMRTAHHGPNVIGYTIFPNQTKKFEIITSVFVNHEEDKIWESTRDPVNIFVIGCIFYTFSQGAMPHITPFVYRILPSGSFDIRPGNGDISPSKIFLLTDAQADVAAD